MTVWPAEQVKLVNLDCYNIIEWEGGTHFIGNDMDRYGARVSTKIQEYDEETKRGMSASKTMYQLHGYPGLDADARYLLSRITEKIKFTLRW